MTQNDNGPNPGRNYGETAVFMSSLKVFFWLKTGFNPKNHPIFLKRQIFIWAKATFFFEQLFPVVARTWLEYRSGFFFGAGNLGFWPKNPFFAIRPQFWLMTHF